MVHNISLDAAHVRNALAETALFRIKNRVREIMDPHFRMLGQKAATRMATPIWGDNKTPAAYSLEHGENLRDLPFTLLSVPDPAISRAPFVFQTLFWWGHGLYFTLLIAAKKLEPYRKRLEENLANLESGTHCFCSPPITRISGRSPQPRLSGSPGSTGKRSSATSLMPIF